MARTWPMRGLTGRHELGGLYSDNHHKCAPKICHRGDDVTAPLKRNSPAWRHVQSVHNFSKYFANNQTNKHVGWQINAEKNKTSSVEVNMNPADYSPINILVSTFLNKNIPYSNLTFTYEMKLTLSL